MSKLITCPRCGGTGQITRKKSMSETKDSGSMPNAYLIDLGVPAKGKKPEFVKCFTCNGFGFIRDTDISKTKSDKE